MLAILARARSSTKRFPPGLPPGNAASRTRPAEIHCRFPRCGHHLFHREENHTCWVVLSRGNRRWNPVEQLIADISAIMLRSQRGGRPAAFFGGV